MANDKSYSAPGTIKARNKENGIIYYIRPQMLTREDHTWEVLTPDEGGATVESATAASEKMNEITEYRTAGGAPFKTEQAARTAMTKKELDEMDWAILPIEGGFLIKKV